MRCSRPITAYRLINKTDSGKHAIVFHMPRGKEILYETIQLPCGKCPDCLLNHAQMWSLRCSHEAEFHTEKCFLTLTYDRNHVPFNNGYKTLEYKDVQLFLKRLRKDLSKSGIKIRFFCSGEYGGNKCRPHYHMILFGFTPKDLTFFRTSYSGLPIFRSKYLEEKWKCGYVFVGTVTSESAGYVARYSMDKQKNKGEKFYEYREKELLRMSRRNGIGFDWISKWYRTVYNLGYIKHDNCKMRIPRFYFTFLEKNFKILYLRLKNRLKKYALNFLKIIKLNDKYDKMLFHRYNISENYRISVVSRLRRNLTHDLVE